MLSSGKMLVKGLCGHPGSAKACALGPDVTACPICMIAREQGCILAVLSPVNVNAGACCPATT